MGNACSEGLTKVVKVASERSTRNQDPPRGNSCEVLSELQIAGRGCILPNNSGHNPKDQYNMSTDPVGTGAFGTVRLATNKKTGKVVAAKGIKKSAIPNMNAFLSEVEINTSMDHPNIVRLYETFEDKQQVYLMMELCSGGELFDMIIEQGFFSEKDAAAVTEQVLRAVFYMHCQRIAHRDLKPENFMLRDKGVPIRKNVLKVIDFGIAGRFKSPASPAGKDEPCMKTISGTAYYVAPEVLSGKYSEKCDVWSIGVILYILLSGTPPFNGDSDEEVMAAVKKAQITFGEEFNKVSKEVKNLILKMCIRNPVQRPSAGECLQSSWIQQQSTLTDSSPVGGAVFKKLKAFSSVNRFKKAALQVIAHRLDDHGVAKLRETFTKLDVNGDGQLTLAEIKEACQSSGLAEELFKQLDADGSGTVGYTEFLAGMIDQKNYLQEELCWEAFRTFDRDGSGQIEMDELQEMLREHKEIKADSIKASDVQQLFQEADKDGDGKISFPEFMAMLRGQ